LLTLPFSLSNVIPTRRSSRTLQERKKETLIMFINKKKHRKFCNSKLTQFQKKKILSFANVAKLTEFKYRAQQNLQKKEKKR
jgi:hypothetical protein